MLCHLSLCPCAPSGPAYRALTMGTVRRVGVHALAGVCSPRCPDFASVLGTPCQPEFERHQRRVEALGESYVRRVVARDRVSKPPYRLGERRVWPQRHTKVEQVRVSKAAWVDEGSPLSSSRRRTLAVSYMIRAGATRSVSASWLAAHSPSEPASQGAVTSAEESTTRRDSTAIGVACGKDAFGVEPGASRSGSGSGAVDHVIGVRSRGEVCELGREVLLKRASRTGCPGGELVSDLDGNVANRNGNHACTIAALAIARAPPNCQAGGACGCRLGAVACGGGGLKWSHRLFMRSPGGCW